jgi:hypothetical protein
MRRVDQVPLNETSREPVSPLLRVARRVKDTIDRDGLARVFIKYCVRILPYQGPPIIAVATGMDLRESENRANASIHSTQKIFTTPDRLGLVPGIRFVEVRRCLGSDD